MPTRFLRAVRFLREGLHGAIADPWDRGTAVFTLGAMVLSVGHIHSPDTLTFLLAWLGSSGCVYGVLTLAAAAPADPDPTA